MRTLSTLALLALIALPAKAQSGDACTVGVAQAELYASDVRARLFNTGGLFWRGGNPVYEVPKGLGVGPVFTSVIWLGGRVQGDVRTVAALYENYEFVPGPLPDAAVPPTDCAAYDRIWTVSQADVLRYNDQGDASADLLTWPVELGAPVVDGDGDPDNYDLAGGDRPAVRGSQTAFWVMNDGGPHPETDSDLLGVEVQVLAWAVASEDAALDQATFYRYRVFNRNAVSIDSLTFAFYADADLGVEFSDDYIGTDPERDLFYFYNSDNEDVGGYGSPPPAWGMRLLDAEAGAGVYFNNSNTIPFSSPQGKHEYWNYMKGIERTGLPFTVGRDGTSLSGETTTFVYPGEPGAYWSEPCASPSCDLLIPAADRRGLLSTVSEALAPGAFRDYTLALPFAFGAQNYGPDGSVEALKLASDRIQAAFDDGSLLTPTPDTYTLLDAPVLLAPAEGASIEIAPPLLSWEPVPGAEFY